MPKHTAFKVIDAGRTAYCEGYALQEAHHAEVLAAREGVSSPGGAPEFGRFILTVHDPVITVTRRPGAAGHVLFSPEALRARGVDLCETDRGGDVTYHGPGQLVCYPIVDLNRLGLRLHEYMRTMEEAVIRTLARFGVEGRRDPGATGVWVPRDDGSMAKVCAMGVRVRRWVTMHGLAINLDPDMGHFDLIVPCGLAGRAVTSLKRETGERCPSMDALAGVLVEELSACLLGAGSRVDQPPLPAG